MTLCFSLPDLHVMGKHETSQAEEVTVVLVLDVDCPPGILPASHLQPLLVLHHHVTANHGEGNDLISGLVIREVEHFDLILSQLVPYLDTAFRNPQT